MTSKPQETTWSRDVRELDSPVRARFIEAHLDLVRYLALRIISRVPSSVEIDDLVNEGIVGLLDAIDKFDPARKVRFRTYAEARVRGAMLDSLRQKDWRPRSVRVMQRDMDRTVGKLNSVHGRPATEEEIADAMGLPMEAFRQLLQNLQYGPMFSLEDLPANVRPTLASTDQQPDEPLARKELIDALAEEIRRLPERERRVVELYYHEGLNMKEVGAVLGVTESRVCQLNSQAAARLRAALESRLHARRDARPRRARGA